MKPSVLGELEKQIMDIVWHCDQCSARSILEILKKERSIAYTTVATILQRLFVKGLVDRRTGDNGYIYVAKITKKQYVQHVTQSFITSSLKSFGNMALVSFAESVDELPKNKKEQLLNLITSYEKNK